MIWLGCLLGNLVCSGFYFGAVQIVQRRVFPFSLEGKDLTRSLVGDEDWGEGSSIYLAFSLYGSHAHNYTCCPLVQKLFLSSSVNKPPHVFLGQLLNSMK